MNTYSRWLTKILLISLILLPIKEDSLLAKIDELKGEFCPNSVFENINAIADPLNVTNNADMFDGVSAETILIRLIFRVLLNTSKISLLVVKTDENDFLIQQFSTFLMYCLYIFQSGKQIRMINNFFMTFLFENREPLQVDERCDRILKRRIKFREFPSIGNNK